MTLFFLKEEKLFRNFNDLPSFFEVISSLKINYKKISILVVNCKPFKLTFWALFGGAQSELAS